jgi:hypothetical protein
MLGEAKFIDKLSLQVFVYVHVLFGTAIPTSSNFIQYDIVLPPDPLIVIIICSPVDNNKLRTLLTHLSFLALLLALTPRSSMLGTVVSR